MKWFFISVIAMTIKRFITAMTMKVICQAIVAILAAASLSAARLEQNSPSQKEALVQDESAKKKLLGLHDLTLQWIGWDRPGKVIISEKDGILSIRGEQRNVKEGDYLTIEGVITSVSEREFTFKGIITTRVSYINMGKPCTREGTKTFVISGSRKYWRLKEYDNLCDDVADYIDIYFR
jgi:hypothetical protein